MILSAQSIRAREGMITPFSERTVTHGMTFGLSSAGYDIRAKDQLTLKPGDFQLASSVERFVMPLDVLARVCDKSTLARKGILVQNTVIEPGWRGYLTLEITNQSLMSLHLQSGAPIAQIVFELLDHPTEQPYEGKYQDQSDEPVYPIFERNFR